MGRDLQLARFSVMSVATVLWLGACALTNQTIATGDTLATETNTVTIDEPPTGSGEEQPVATGGVATTSVPVQGEVNEVFVPFPESADDTEWDQVVLLGYGDEPGGLGAGPGHGPELPARGMDGSWWVPDTDRFRIVHFDSDGRFLEDFETAVTSSVFGLQVTEGGVVMASTSRPSLLRIDDGQVGYQDTAPTTLELITTAGEVAYATPMLGNSRYSVTPTGTGLAVARVDAFTSWSGQAYSVEMVARNTAEVWVADSGSQGKPLTIRLVLEPNDGGSAFGIVEYETDLLGNIHLLFYGLSSKAEKTQLSVYVRISPAGEVLSAPTPNPLGEFDSGSVGHLTIDPRTGVATLATVTTDGIRIYQVDCATACDPP